MSHLEFMQGTGVTAADAAEAGEIAQALTEAHEDDSNPLGVVRVSITPDDGNWIVACNVRGQGEIDEAEPLANQKAALEDALRNAHSTIEDDLEAGAASRMTVAESA